MTRAAAESRIRFPIQSPISYLLSSIFCLLFVVSANAITADSNPYHGIVDRNVFGLKDPPPPPPPNPDAGKPPTPPITLTGITTVLGNKRAFLTLQLPAKPPEPAKIASLMLTEGQRDGEVEVLEIDEKERTVKVNTYGTITNLSFEKNGSKGSGSGTGPAVVNSGIPAPASVFNPGGGTGPKTIPTRMVRLGPGPAATPENTGGSPAAFTPGSTGSTGATFTPGNYNPGPTQPQAEAQLTPAQNEILTEAAYQAALANKKQDPSIFPPSFLDPTRNVVPTPGTTDPNAVVPGQQKFPLPRNRPY